MSFYELWINVYRAIVLSYPQGLDEPTANLLAEFNKLIFSYDELSDDNNTKKLTIISKLKELIADKQEFFKDTPEIKTLLNKFFNLLTKDSITPITSDVLNMILGELPPEDLASMARVSRRFRTLASNPLFWRNLKIRHSGRDPSALAITPKDAYSKWYGGQYPEGTRRLFSLVLSNDLQGLKVNTKLITIDSLYEFNIDKKSYLEVARDKKYQQIIVFIIKTLEEKASTEYLKLKLKVALGNSSSYQSSSVVWQNLAQHFCSVQLRDNQVANPIIPAKPKHELVKLIVQNNDQQALVKLLGDIEPKGNDYDYKNALTLAKNIAADYCTYSFVPLLGEHLKYNVLNIEFINTLLSWLPNKKHRQISIFVGFMLEALVSYGHVSLVQHIVECLITKGISYGPRVLEAALEHHPPRIEVVKYLLAEKKGVNIQALATQCLPHALETDFRFANPTELTCAKLLVEAGAMYPPSGDERYGSLGCLALLTDVKDNQQLILTTLTYFRSKFNFKINGLRTKDDNTLLHLACRDNHALALELLKEEWDVNLKNKYGNTPLHCYVVSLFYSGSPYVSVENQFEKSITVFYLLLRSGADPNLMDETGQTAAMFCKSKRGYPCYERILKDFQVQADFNQCVIETHRPNPSRATIEMHFGSAIKNNYGLTYLFLKDNLANPAVSKDQKVLLFECFKRKISGHKSDLAQLEKYLTPAASNLPRYGR